MDDIYLSPQKLAQLQQEYALLKSSLDKENEEGVKRGGPMDSFKEAAAFAVTTQAKKTKVEELADILSNAQVLADEIAGKKIVLGKWFIVKGALGQKKYRLVDPIEADPAQNLVSSLAPLGQLLVNKKAGDSVILNGQVLEIVEVL